MTSRCTGSPTPASPRFYWENINNNFSAVVQKTNQIKIPVAITVFPHEIYRAPESRSRQACPSLYYFHEAGEGRSIYRTGSIYADVTEGSGGIWERLYYNWSNPNRIMLTTTDSNVWGAGSGHIYTFTRQPDGTTEVDLVVVREGKNFKGWALGLLLRTAGKGVLQRAFENSVKAIEARNYPIGVQPATRNRTAA